MFEQAVSNIVWIALGVLAGIIMLATFNRLRQAHRIRKAIRLADELAGAKGLILRPGWAHNPALKYPPNYPCFCGTGQKFKKCCLSKLPRYVREKSLPKIQAELTECLNFVRSNLGELKPE